MDFFRGKCDLQETCLRDLEKNLMSPRLKHLVVVLDNKDFWIVMEEVSIWVDHSFIAFSCLEFTTEDLTGSFF